MREPDCFLLLERAADRDADDEALAPGRARLWRSTTVTFASDVRIVMVGRAAATSARIRWPSGRCDDSSRRMNALIVPVADRRGPPSRSRCRRPSTRSTMRSTRSSVGADRRRRRSSTRRRRRRRSPSRLSRRGDVVDHHRVLLALVLGVGEHERQQLLARRTPRSSSSRSARRVVRVGDVGPGVRIVPAGRRVDGDACRTGSARGPSAR